MRYFRILWMIVVIALVIGQVGCGRPVLPGQQFRQELGDQAAAKTPKQTVLELGNKAAKVKIIAFYAIDEENKPLLELLKSLVAKYPGKLYVKYVDIRSEEGKSLAEQLNMGSSGLRINNKASFEILAKPKPYVVEFTGDLGRFWMPDDLKQAVTQEIAKAYGK